MTKELVVIAGPTAIGKTLVGAELAERNKSVVLSADSRQFYREMSIGTAVPEEEILRRVPHYFIQHLSIKDYYNASMYENQVLELLKKLFIKHDRVFMVGGSGLYIDAIRFGIDDLPSYDPHIRQELQEKIENEGLDSLTRELKELDPVSHSRIDLNNPKRVQKAMEIIRITGKPYSAFITGKRRERDFAIRLVALNTDRQTLYERINERVLLMMEKGLLEEVRRLSVYRMHNALNTVGYKELFDYLDGKLSLDEAVIKIQNNTRKFARKQITWFRKEGHYQWFEPVDIKGIQQFIDKPLP